MLKGEKYMIYALLIPQFIRWGECGRIKQSLFVLKLNLQDLSAAPEMIK